jgi:hypothetical protein
MLAGDRCRPKLSIFHSVYKYTPSVLRLKLSCRALLLATETFGKRPSFRFVRRGLRGLPPGAPIGLLISDAA